MLIAPSVRPPMSFWLAGRWAPSGKVRLSPAPGNVSMPPDGVQFAALDQRLFWPPPVQVRVVAGTARPSSGSSGGGGEGGGRGPRSEFRPAGVAPGGRRSHWSNITVPPLLGREVGVRRPDRGMMSRDAHGRAGRSTGPE